MDDIDNIDLPPSSMNNKKPFLKKGDGKLASNHHGSTEFSLKRQQSFVIDQLKNEKNHHQNNVEVNALVEKYLGNMKKQENIAPNNDKHSKKNAWK